MSKKKGDRQAGTNPCVIDKIGIHKENSSQISCLRIELTRSSTTEIAGMLLEEK